MNLICDQFIPESPAVVGRHDSDSRHPPRRDGVFLDQYLDAQENERLRMGRELQDSTGQLLLALSLGLATLRNTQDIGQRDVLLEEIDETVGEIDRELRTFAFLHFPTDLNNRGLATALGALCKGFGKRTGLTMSFRGSCQRPIADVVAFSFLRIAQEALTNIHRHAHATNVKVRLNERPDRLELAISDDGIGMAPKDVRDCSGGIGIEGMRHRIEKLGGRFAIHRLKRGAKIMVSLNN